MDREIAETLRRSGGLSVLDCSFADFLNRRTERDDPLVWSAAALVSQATGLGHVCLDLPTAAGVPLPLLPESQRALNSPDLAVWRSRLLSHPAVGRPGESRPLILDAQDRLYLHRYWSYEQSLAVRVQQDARCPIEPIDEPTLSAGLARLFGERADGRADWQKIAACAAVLNRFCIITGGPGTGKTTTVAKVLALLIEQPSATPLRIALTAPTGKAAARLQESIGKARESLSCTPALRERMPSEALTLHRLLGSIPGSPNFRHNADRPLPFDVVVVDEASMVDLALMAKLADALPRGSRLILLGDKNQLASVQAGAVLGDLCGPESTPGFSQTFASRIQRLTGMDMQDLAGSDAGPPIRDCIVELKESHRFGDESGIGALASAINNGNGAFALKLLQSGQFTNIHWRELPPTDRLRHDLKSDLLEGFMPYLSRGDLHDMARTFGKFRVLCALRLGPYGAPALNALIEQLLREDGRIDPGTWYTGKPIMITTNDYNLRLYNGDIGIAAPEDWSAPEGSSVARRDMRAHFVGSDGTARWLPLPRLPAHETAYAMTVHKSQGSEFDLVHVIMPDRDAPVLTRELLYTAVTRAREGVVIWGRGEIFERAVTRRLRRSSGLRDALWNTQEAIETTGGNR
ncbi:MAG: exodeoxyribonuclease V subunit alpha [Syntrophobacteraceae bacterium]